MADQPFSSALRLLNPQQRPWAVAWAVIALAACLLTWVSWERHGATQKEAETRISAKAQLANMHVLQILRSASTSLDQLAVEAVRTGRCNQALVSQLSRVNPEYRAVSISDQRGIIVCASLPVLLGQDRSKEEYVRTALEQIETAGMVIGQPIKSKLTNVAILPLYKVISLPGSQEKLLLHISIDLSFFDQMLASLTGPGQTLSLVHDSGIMLSRVPGPNLYRLQALSKTLGVLATHRQNGEQLNHVQMTSDLDGAEHFFASMEITPSSLPIPPHGKLLIIASEAVTDVYAGWRRNTGAMAAGWLLLSCFLLAMVRAYNGRRQQQARLLETQQRKLEDLLAANMRLMKEHDALDAHAIVSATDIHGTIVFANTKFCESSGYAAHELLGQNHRLLNSKTHPPEFFQGMWRTIRSGQVWHGLICNRAKGGHLYWFNSTIVPIRDGEGQIDRFISIRTDVSELIKVQEALRESEQALRTAKEAAERQQAIAEEANRKKSEFLASMSHELRTPMNSILGFSQILQMEELDAEMMEYVSHIHKSGQHLLRLINDLLDLSRIETGRIELKTETVNLTDLINDAVSTITPMGERYDVTVEQLSIQQDLLVEADEQRLRQVLLNLISNAIKYNRRQGTVSISAHSLGGRVRIAVQDTGIGMTTQELEKLFEPYTRFAPANVEGTGIGLTITKRIVEALGGSISVESIKDVGSTFWLEFKTAQAQALPPMTQESATDAPDDHPPTARFNATVLYIEDNIPNQQLVVNGFKRIPGLRLLVASAPYIGLQMVTRMKPDLILLDINLPEFDGFEVFNRLREKPETSHIPVIGISANAMPGDIEKAKTAGFDDYLAKPVNLSALRRLVLQYLQQRKAA